MLVPVVGVVFLLIAFFLLKSNKGGKSAAAVEPIALKESAYQSFKLIQKTQVSPNTCIFRFALGASNQRVGLPTGKHMMLKFIDAEGKPIMRAYTPISSDDDLGYFDLLIKMYDTGKMSQHLKSLEIGSTIDVRGPIGSLEYTGSGEFTIKRAGGRIQQSSIKSVGMIAGGSGITPMYQILREVSKRAGSDMTRLSLIFANQTESDILLRTELDQFRESRSLTDITYTLDRPAESWTGAKGFVTPDLIKANLPPPSSSTLILLCGPKPMVDMMEKHLQALGYTEDMYFKY